MYTAISRKVVVKERKTVSDNSNQLVLTQTLFSFCRTNVSKQLYPYKVDLRSYEPHAPDLYFKPPPPFSVEGYIYTIALLAVQWEPKELKVS